MSTGIVGNADRWTVVFEDAEGKPIDPDGEVRWTVTNPYGKVIQEVTQDVEDRKATGTFELLYTPDRSQPYHVKAAAVVQGADQATPAVRRNVEP